ncbi:hypothetical protein C0J52_04310, partial [Blattella germanica]
GSKPPGGARAIVETLGALGDGDLSALTLPHNSDQYTSSELETLANIQAELDRLNSAVEVEGTLGEDLEGGGDSLTVGEPVDSVVTVVSDDHGQGDIAHSPEAILPEIMEETTTVEELDMREIGMSTPSPEAEDPLQQDPVPKQFTSVSNNLSFASSTVTSKTTGSSIVVIQSPVASSASVTSSNLTPTHVTVSGGQLLGKITGMSSNVAISSVPQFQSLSQTLVTAKSADGNIVQLRPATLNRPLTATSTATSLSSANLQGIKPLQASSIKRPASGSTGQMRNVFAKVIITGNQQGQQGQPIMLATSQSGESFSSGQPIKIISGGSGQNTVSLLGSPTKAITLAQAQQLGLISPTKLQQILPSSPTKQSIIVNKLVSSPVKSPAKITMMPASTVVKSPTKILPAPVSGITQLKSTSSIASAAGAIGGTVNTVKPLMSPQKVIIRQSSLKPGTVLTSSSGTGQVIRIPATQNVPVVSASGLSQIQVPGGRQLQYVRLVSTSGSSTTTVTSTGKSRAATVVPVSAVSGGKPIALAAMRTQPPTVKMVPIAPATPTIRTLQNQQSQQQQQQSPAPQQSILNTQSSVNQSSSNSTSNVESHNQSRQSVPTRTTLEPNGIRPRKPCNCTKSQCLKLYCDCFANGEFCHMCNCNNCFNNLEHEEDRQRAIKSCLERNPNAFRPKIGKGVIGDERRHNKGCNCKRSGCLKNYCECYEAKIPCSNNCKCVGCRNVEESCDKKTLRDLAEAAEVRVQQQTAIKNKVSAQIQDAFRPQQTAPSGTRQPFNFMTQEVLDATCLCLLAQAEEAERLGCSEEDAERYIIEEFGRCLVQIIECSAKSEASPMPM